MSDAMTRETILSALRAALEPLPAVHAMWEGGAAAFGRVDQWSDIDLQVDVDDEAAADVAQRSEAALLALRPFSLRYEMPQPAWHGHYQVFYQFEGASPYLMLDFVIIRHGNPNKFLETQIHGQAVVHFDKSGVTRPPDFDSAAWERQLRARREVLKVTFPLFQPLVTKEVQRGNAVEALAFYQGMTLRPLVEAVRMRHAPHHYNFHTRYVYYDLPAEVARRLERLFFVPSLAEVEPRRAEAEAWFNEVMAQFDGAGQ